MYHTSYGAPPNYSTAYDYRSPGVSYGYFSPRYSSHTATPSPRASLNKHQRRATQDFIYNTPRRSSYQYHASPEYATQQRKADYVSDSDRPRSKSRRFEAHADGRGGFETRPKAGAFPNSRTIFVFENGEYEVYDDREEYLPRYEERYPRTTPPPPYSPENQRHRDAEADFRAYYDQVPIYTRADEPATTQQRPSRPRRASYATKPQPQQSPPKTRPAAAKPPPQATDNDARNAGIPAGYSFKYWDPREEPILLLGSVFDAHSLGKWIYDWTVAWHGPSTPMSEIAGDLWLLLIQLAGKIKRAEEGLPRVRREEDREMIEDFLDSGERLWRRFNKLLKVCESYMLEAAKRESGSGKPLQMGKRSGCEFVDSIFGRDRELEWTEKLMTGIRLWSMRFDANCEDVFRRPGA